MFRKIIYQCSKQIVSSAVKKQETFKQMLSPELEKPQIITNQEADEKYVRDYTKSPTKMEFSEEDPFSKTITAKIVNNEGHTILYETNTKTTLEMKHNPLALEALINKEVTIDKIDVTTIKSNVLNGELQQADLGSVYVMPENTIHISEVDVNNIPADKDIQIDREEKILYAIGTKGNDQIYSEKLSLQQTIIEDITFQEYKDKYLYKIEQPFAYLSKGKALKSFIRWLPFYFIMFCFLETWWDLHHLKTQLFLIEEQELKQLSETIFQKQNEMLLSDKIYSVQ